RTTSITFSTGPARTAHHPDGSGFRAELARRTFGIPLSSSWSSSSSTAISRLDVAVRSPLGFRRGLGLAPPLEELRKPPETTGIEFEGRLFVWHYLEPRDDPDLGYQEFGPSVTVIHEEVDEKSWIEPANALQRFLSAV